MRQVVCKFLMVLILMAIASPGYAKLMENGRNDRRGFFLGFGLGGGGMNFNLGGTTSNKGAFLSDVKIGGGITDNILLMYNGSVLYTKISGVDVTILNVPVAVQWFVFKDLYIRPGVGLSFTRLSTGVLGTTVTANSKTSFGIDFASGYEFRFGRYFALSPEFVYHYSRLRFNGGSGNAHSYGVQGSLLWYF